MKQFSRSFWPVSLLVLLIVAIFLMGFIFTGAVALLFGALLQSFLPFTLFEATILSTLFAAVTVYWFWRLVTTIAPPEVWQQPVREHSDEEEEEEQSYQTIAKSRFYQQEQERTWESWLREELANDI